MMGHFLRGWRAKAWRVMQKEFYNFTKTLYIFKDTIKFKLTRRYKTNQLKMVLEHEHLFSDPCSEAGFAASIYFVVAVSLSAFFSG